MHLWTVPITIVEALVLEMPLGTLQFFVHYTCMGSGSTWIARVCAFLGECFDSNLCDCVTLGHSLLLVQNVYNGDTNILLCSYVLPVP